MDQWRAVMLTIKTWRLKMEPWRVSRPVIAVLHPFDKKQAPDPDPDRHKVLSGSAMKRKEGS